MYMCELEKKSTYGTLKIRWHENLFKDQYVFLITSFEQLKALEQGARSSPAEHEKGQEGPRLEERGEPRRGRQGQATQRWTPDRLESNGVSCYRLLVPLA